MKNPVVGFAVRLVGALLLVFATYNPTGTSYFNWLYDGTEGKASVKAVVGILLLIVYVIYLRATWKSLGTIGVALTAALLGVMVWLMVDFGLFSLSEPSAFAWVVLVIVAVVMAVGMSWSHFRAKASGQVDVDAGAD